MSQKEAFQFTQLKNNKNNKKMKKIFTILALLIGLMGYAQNITLLTDEMTGKSSYEVDNSVHISDSGKDVVLYPHIDYSSKEFDYIGSFMSGFSSCNKEDEMIILFEDGSRFTAQNIARFNCDGLMIFPVRKRLREKLFSTPIDKIRVTNKRSFESITQEIKNPNYFIELGENLKEL